MYDYKVGDVGTWYGKSFRLSWVDHKNKIVQIEMLESPYGYKFINMRDLSEVSISEPDVIQRLWKKCMDNMRYGDFSEEFSFQELMMYANIKYKRGFLILRQGDHLEGDDRRKKMEKALDDVLDAVNIALRAAQKIQKEIDG